MWEARPAATSQNWSQKDRHETRLPHQSEVHASATLVIGDKTSKLHMMKRLLPLLLLLLSSATLAESGSYRVEVIVFRNLMVATEATRVQELRSFSQFPDTREVSLPEQSADGSPEVPRSDLPDDLNIITQKSTRMGNVWRSLGSSQGYRPLLYAAWEQNRTDYYPPMRIHDQQVIDTQLRPPTNIIIADLAAEDPLAAYRSSFYQLDGSVQLRRSRFLHLFLDLEYREEKLQTGIEPGFLGGNEFQSEMETGAADPENYGVFSLKQNRQTRTNEMQYFDTPYFAALVWVSAIPAK